ncbi:MAG: tripartite tricarboxylate transporter substrate binding protein [Beijerinckiaceae bacterium]|nr:tripartite tricarboxylate transporter substrate binding protein [Beijerinckiaceae bacterium]
MKRFKLACALVAIWSGAATAQAQPAASPFPDGQMTFIVPLAAGGPLDGAARMMAERIGQRLGRTIIVENRTGAGGNIGAAYVAKAAPDGLTWLYTIDSVLTVNPHLYASQGFDAAKDLIPAARVGVNTLALVVNVSRVDVKTFGELLALSKTRELNFASAGIGAPGHLAFEYLRMETGIRGAHVPYRGAAPAMQDIVGGAVEAGFVTAGASLPHIQTGVLRALAVSSLERAPQLPNVPTADEAGVKGFEARFGNYLLAPSKSDPKMRAVMGGHVEEVMKNKDVQDRLMALATDPVFADEKTSIERIAADREKWGKVVKASGMKASP